MLAVLAFGLLLTAFYGFAFGATYLLLRRTAWQQFSLEAPWLTGPALLVLLGSVLGYHEPHTFPAWQAWTLLAGGWGLSVCVFLWDRAELTALARQNGPRTLLILLPASLAAGLFLWFYPGNEWDDIFIPRIGEYLNYAELAVALTGQHHGDSSTLVFEFCRHHHRIRYGQDIVVAAVAQVALAHPVQVVIPLAVLFRFQHAVALGLIVFYMARSRDQWLGAVLVLVLDALLLIELVFFSYSFFSSNCTMPLYMVYLIWLGCHQEFRFRECTIIVLMNLFFWLTYPEFLVIAKLFEGLAMVVALGRGNWRMWLPLACCNVAFLAMHPVLLWRQAGALLAQISCGAGWSVISDPVRTPMQFFGSLAGLRFGSLAVDPLYKELHRHAWVTWVFMALVLGQISVGLVLLARRFRVTAMLSAWLAMLVGLHAWYAYYGPHYYAAYKILSHTYFVLILAAAALLFTSQAWWRRAAVGALALWLVTVGVCTFKLVPLSRANANCVSYAHFRDRLRALADNKTIAVLCDCNEYFFLANMVAGETNLTLTTLTKDQRSLMGNRQLGRTTDCIVHGADGPCYDGLVLCDSNVAEKGQSLTSNEMLAFDCRKVVGRVGHLLLCEGRVYHSRSVVLPPFYWIHGFHHETPVVLASTQQLHLEGDVMAYCSFPYRFTCRLSDLDWSQEVVVEQAGPFEVILNLPEAALHRLICVDFQDYGTFRPCDYIKGSCDTNQVGFMVRAMRFQ